MRKFLKVRKGRSKSTLDENCLPLQTSSCCSYRFLYLALMYICDICTLLNDVPLSAANAFGTLALFNVLRFPLMELGQILSVCTSIHCVGRIAKFVFQSHTGIAGASKTNRNINSEEMEINIVKIVSNSSFMWTVNESEDNAAFKGSVCP